MTQLLYIVGAITLLGLLLVPARKMALNRQQILMATEATTTATAIGQELLEEVIVRKFDENKCDRTDTAKNVSEVSTTLGPDAGESTINQYDDLDDFNGYVTTTVTPRLGNFTDSVKVYYVAEASPDAKAGSNQWLKRIDVKVKNPWVLTKDSSVTVSKIVSYRYRGGS